MKIELLIRELQELQKIKPGAEVRLNDCHGTTALFALTVMNANDDVNSELKDVVWIEGKDDIDLAEEIDARFTYAAETQMDELDFFMDLIALGITLDEIKQYAPERYEYSKTYMEEHGLI